MKNKVSISIIYILLGVLIALAPTIIFPVCSGEMKMSCAYTEKAEIGLGVLIAVLGGISFFLSEKVRAGISIAVAGIGILSVLIPTVLIGVCGSSMMKCNVATRPLLVVLGVLTILVAVINTVYLLKKRGSE